MGDQITDIEVLQRRIELLESDLKQAKEQISLLNSELQQANEGWSGEWEMDLVSKQIKWNLGVYQLLDIDESTSPDMRLFKDRLDPLDLDKLNGAIKKTFVSQQDYSFEHYITYQNGSKEKISARTDLKPIVNNQGQVIKLLGKLTDISKIKAESRQLEKLSTIAANTSNAVVVLDVDAKLDWVNSAFTMLTGYRPEEAGGLLFDDLIDVDHQDKCCADLFAEAFRTTNEVIQEIGIKRKKGGINWTVLNISPILDYTLNPEGYIVIITDITELKNAQEEIAKKNSEITDSIRYARRIQNTLLSPEQYIQDNLPNSFVLFLPKDIVSGDFYWVNKKEDAVLFSAIDCTGHGVPGAFVSIVAHGTLQRSVHIVGLRKPNDILDNINEVVNKQFELHDLKDGMDMALCRLHPKERIIEYSGANNPLYIVRSNQHRAPKFKTPEPELTIMNHGAFTLYELKPNKQPVGRFEKKVPFDNHEIQLESGDMVYVFTDGYPDQFGGPRGKKMKYKRFKELLLQHAHLSVTDQKNELQTFFDAWKGDLEQVDDVCVIGVRV